jgi:mRNA interferase RelE/StbE
VAVRDLAKLSDREAARIGDTLSRFAETMVGDVRKLNGVTPATWRLRVGRYRVLYEIEGSTIVVRRILDRRDAYR